jgi:hypothetical protein
LVLLILALHPGPPSGSSFNMGMPITVPGCTMAGTSVPLNLAS